MASVSSTGIGPCAIRSADELEHERFQAVRFLEPMDARDVRMIQRSEKLRFPLESCEPFVIVGEFFGKNFDRDVALELRVARAIDLAHTAFSDWRDDLVGAEARSGGERH